MLNMRLKFANLKPMLGIKLNKGLKAAFSSLDIFTEKIQPVNSLKPFLRALSVSKIKKLQYPTGVFAAAKPKLNTGYDKAWIRDNIYIALGLEKARRIKDVKRTYHALLDLLLKHEYKIDWAIREKPDAKYKYIHARFCPLSFDEFHEDWGNKQNDAIGAFLFMIGSLHEKGIEIIRDANDYRIVQKLVYYLESIQYWQDPDNGMWENEEELHASSIGACVAGLEKIKAILDVPAELIENGYNALNSLLPRESPGKEVDLALLSLIFPYNIVTNEQRDAIIENVEKKLVREHGVIRYFGDWYYNNNGREAEWTMGFPWLAIVYKQKGDYRRYLYYLKKTLKLMNWKGELPELYLGGSSDYNENTPLGWNHALLLCAISS